MVLFNSARSLRIYSCVSIAAHVDAHESQLAYITIVEVATHKGLNRYQFDCFSVTIVGVAEKKHRINLRHA